MEKKKRFSFIIFVIGILVLVFGLVLILLKLINIDDRMQDGEYLVEKKEWALVHTSTTDEPWSTGTEFITNCGSGGVETNCIDVVEVIWQFTEIGKGTLTTNDHLNDYDFIWALEDGKLKIETSWLYLLENEYEYELNQESGLLKLADGEKFYYFTAIQSNTDY
jgi:hypothetical protein